MTFQRRRTNLDQCPRPRRALKVRNRPALLVCYASFAKLTLRCLPHDCFPSVEKAKHFTFWHNFPCITEILNLLQRQSSTNIVSTVSIPRLHLGKNSNILRSNLPDSLFSLILARWFCIFSILYSLRLNFAGIELGEMYKLTRSLASCLSTVTCSNVSIFLCSSGLRSCLGWKLWRTAVSSSGAVLCY
jgi:hypothetical protein